MGRPFAGVLSRSHYLDDDRRLREHVDRGRGQRDAVVQIGDQNGLMLGAAAVAVKTRSRIRYAEN